MNLMQGVAELIPHFGIKASCSQLNVPRASYNRWRAGRNATPAARRNVHSRPPRSLDDSEIKQVEETLNSERFADQSPRAVYAALLDEEKYLCSWRTMYRIMGRNRQVRERRNQLRHPLYEKPQLVATAPNQLWSWDITRLMGPSKGVYYHLYVIIDVYSRYITGWMIADRESSDLATRFIEETCTKQRIKPGQLTVHADRGSSMMSKPLALLMEDLGIRKSHSRPRVSNDNPFSESQFKTMKYRHDYPGRFGSLKDARAWANSFFTWYNSQHYHSGIGLLSPGTVHYGKAESALIKRQQVLETAYAARPERFVKGSPTVPALPRAVWINRPISLMELAAEQSKVH